MKRFAAIVLSLTVAGAFAYHVIAAGGPPPFLTTPILMHVAESALDHGHFVFAEGAALPAPLAPDRGAAIASGAAPGTNLVTTGTDQNVSNTDDAYEGETGAAATGSLIVAGS